jgi:Na+/H+ antiporter NhaD/arsenite permease-like protein
VFVLSSFLDNIASALIGGTVARHSFGNVHIGYLAAIVATSNAGGAGSVVGDTTTTMMWVAGVSPLNVVQAYVGAIVALLIFRVTGIVVTSLYFPVLLGRVPVLGLAVWTINNLRNSTVAPLYGPCSIGILPRGSRRAR